MAAGEDPAAVAAKRHELALTVAQLWRFVAPAKAAAEAAAAAAGAGATPASDGDDSVMEDAAAPGAAAAPLSWDDLGRLNDADERAQAALWRAEEADNDLKALAASPARRRWREYQIPGDLRAQFIFGCNHGGSSLLYGTIDPPPDRCPHFVCAGKAPPWPPGSKEYVERFSLRHSGCCHSANCRNHESESCGRQLQCTVSQCRLTFSSHARAL